MRTGIGSLSGYEINARLPKVDGLAVGTDVRLSGIKIGTVTDLTLDPKTYLVTVHMNIRDDIKLPTDSSVLVTSAGFLGSQYLSHHARRRRQDDGRRAAIIENAPGLDRPDGPGGRFAIGGSTANQPPRPSRQRPAASAQPPDPGAGP